VMSSKSTLDTPLAAEIEEPWPPTQTLLRTVLLLPLLTERVEVSLGTLNMQRAHDWSYRQRNRLRCGHKVPQRGYFDR
jgi:hypothetical protein